MEREGEENERDVCSDTLYPDTPGSFPWENEILTKKGVGS
jgi:hypothetical protein